MGSFLHQLTADRRAAAGVPGDRGEAGRPMVRGRPFGDRAAPGRLSTGAAEAKRWTTHSQLEQISHLMPFIDD